MTSKLYIKSLLCLCLAFQFSFITNAEPAFTISSSSVYGPVERDCHHSRITCIEGNNTLFAVKGPLTFEQVNQLCPSTPKQTVLKRNRLPSNMLNPMIIANVGSHLIEYTQHQNSIEKTTTEILPKFAYVLCGTAEHKPNSGQHDNADRPIPLDTFLANSFAADQVKNTPTYNKFEAPDRKFAFREVALGDSLAYMISLFPSSEVNYEIVAKHIVGYQLDANYRDISAKFDKEERLYEFVASVQEEGTSLSDSLNKLVALYGKPVTKGRTSLDYDLDPANEVKSGTYIWKISAGGYLTISIKTAKNTSINVKLVDISQAEKVNEYANKIKKQGL